MGGQLPSSITEIPNMALVSATYKF